MSSDVNDYLVNDFQNLGLESSLSGGVVFDDNASVPSSRPEPEEDDAENKDEVCYIQMEYCEKKTLREVIQSGDLVGDRFRMWKLFRQIVEGIAYFHSKDIIHRDLKV